MLGRRSNRGKAVATTHSQPPITYPQDQPTVPDLAGPNRATWHARRNTHPASEPGGLDARLSSSEHSTDCDISHEIAFDAH